ncbi:hypothetical protein AcV7_006245 [Taiwanofungus camphoratus]|nr:hypothetical protein AcV7_006245 [Antrodia cinnamomea]
MITHYIQAIKHEEDGANNFAVEEATKIQSFENWQCISEYRGKTKSQYSMPDFPLSHSSKIPETAYGTNVISSPVIHLF